MTDVIYSHPAANIELSVPAAIRTVRRSLRSAGLGGLRPMSSAVRRWWVDRSAAQTLAGLDGATLRDLAIPRSDVERMVRQGRR